MTYEQIKISDSAYEITMSIDGEEEVFTCITGTDGVDELDDLIAFRVAAIRQERAGPPIYGD